MAQGPSAAYSGHFWGLRSTLAELGVLSAARVLAAVSNGSGF